MLSGKSALPLFGTRARFNAHLHNLIEPAIADRQGRIVKTMGDGLLVEFASVVDAVECAIAIQNGMKDCNADEPDDRHMEFRMGVNLGDVIIEGDDIHGDGVNVAARLEALARLFGSAASAAIPRPTYIGVSDSAKNGSFAMASCQFSSRTSK